MALLGGDCDDDLLGVYELPSRGAPPVLKISSSKKTAPQGAVFYYSNQDNLNSLFALSGFGGQHGGLNREALLGLLGTGCLVFDILTLSFCHEEIIA
jgi:hypothetical protein